MDENANEKMPPSVVVDRDHAAAVESLDSHVDGLTDLTRSEGYDLAQAWGGW